MGTNKNIMNYYRNINVSLTSLIMKAPLLMKVICEIHLPRDLEENNITIKNINIYISFYGY